MVRCLLSICVLVLLLQGNDIRAAEAPMPDVIVRQVSRILENVDEDPQAAIDALAELMERRRRTPRVAAYIVRQKAALLIREQQLEQARDDLRGVLEGQPQDFALPLRLMLGQALLMLDDYPGGLQALESWASHVQTPDPTGLFLLGYGYLRAEQLDLAIARLEAAMAALEERPRNHWIELLAYAYARAGRPLEAQQLIEDLIARDPSQTRWWRQLAAVLLLMENVPRGTSTLSIAEQIEPDNYEQTKRLARFLAHVGVPADGADLLTAALAGPDVDAPAEDHLLLAEMWVLAREFDAAVAALENAQRLDPEDGKPALVLGQLYLHWEQYEPASIALERAVAAYAEQARGDLPAQANYLLAIAYINLDRLTDALAALDRLGDEEEYAARGAALERFIANRRRAGQAGGQAQ